MVFLSTPCRHLGTLALLALAIQLTHAQSRSIAACVSTPGVNFQLLSACEGLRSQLATQLSPGATVQLATQIELSPTTASSTNNGFPASRTDSGVSRTSALASSDGFGGPGESTSSAAFGGFGGFGSLGPSATSQAFGGFGGRPSSTSNDAFPFFASTPASSSSGFDFGIGASSTGTGNGNSPSDTASSGNGDNGTSDPASSTAGAAGAQNSNSPGLMPSASNSDPHHYRNTVVIPVAVVCTVVPLLLLALLACCLLMRRRKRKSRESVIIADAENEKYANAHGTSQATAVGAAAPAAGAAYGTKHTHGQTNPFADPSSANGAGFAPSGAHPGLEAGTAGGHHGIGTGTAAGLGAGALAGAGAAGLVSHEHSKRDTSTAGRSSMSSGKTPMGVRPSGVPPAYTAYGPSASEPHAPGGSEHHSLGPGIASGLGAGAAGLAAHEHSHHGTSNVRQHDFGPSQPPNTDNGYPSHDPRFASHHGPGMGTSAGLGAGAGGLAAREHAQRQDPNVGHHNLATSQPSYNNNTYHDSNYAGHHGAGIGTAAGLGTGAGAAGIADHERSRQPSTPSDYSSATSQQGAFDGFSGGNTPMGASPVPPSESTAHSSVLGPSAVAGAGGAALGGATASRYYVRDHEPRNTTSTSQPDRPPMLPPMGSELGSGRWINPEYDQGPGANMPRDSATLSGSDYGAPLSDTSDRLSGGIAAANLTRPPAGHSIPVPGNNNQLASTSALDDPFKTPSSSAASQSMRQSNDTPSGTIPVIPHQPPYRSPQPPPQPQFTHQQRPRSPLDSGSKASRVLGFDSGSGRASPAPRPQPQAPGSTQRGPWNPPAIGEIREGPFRGSAYVPPQIGPEEGDTLPSSAQTSLSESQMQPGVQTAQYTSYPTEDEVRSFDFGNNGDGNGHGEERDSFGVPRKPVGGR